MPFGDVYKPYADSYRLVAEENKREAPSGGEILGAAFQLENDVVAAWHLANKPAFEKDFTFDPLKKTQESEFWDTNREAFVGTQSEAEWEWRAAKLRNEEHQREILASSGLAGFGAMLLAGVASPTMLLPAATPYRGLKGVLAASALGATAAGLQEVPLQADQLSRTASEGAIAVAMGAVTGGVLGGAVNLLRKGEMEVIQHGVAREHGSVAIPTSPVTKTQVIEAREAALKIAKPSEEIARIGGRLDADQVVTKNDIRTLMDQAKPVQDFVESAFGPYVDVSPTVSKSNQIVRWSIDPTTPDAPVVRLPVKEIIHVTQDGDFISANGTDSPYHVKTTGELSNPAVILEDRRPASARPDLEETELYATQSGGAAANPQLPVPQGLKAKSAIEKAALNKLARISPVADTIAQEEFQTLRAGMAAISTGGLKLEGNILGEVSSRGGTVEARRGLYDRYVADLVKVQDEYYTDYFYNGEVTGPFPTARAGFKSTFRWTGEKLTRDQFNIEVSRAVIEGDHPQKQVAKAANIIRTEIIEPLEDEMRAVGIIQGDVDLGEDKFWLSRQYDKAKIDRDPTGLVDMLADHYGKLLKDDFARSANRLKEQEKIIDEYIDDTRASLAEVDKRKKAFKDRLEGLEETDEETLLRTKRSDLRKEKDPDARRKLKEEIKVLAKATADPQKVKRDLRRRLRNLDRSYWGLDAKREATLNRIDETEARALSSLKSVLSKGKALQRDLDKISDKELRKQLRILNERFNRYQFSWVKREERLQKLGEQGDLDEYYKYWNLINKTHEVGQDRMDELLARFDDTENLLDNREVLRELLHDLSLEASENVNRLNLQRGARMERYRQKLKDLDPKIALDKVAESKKLRSARRANFNDRMRELGIDDFNLETGEALVEDIARRRAEETVQKIQKLNNRISGLHTIGEERGSELERVLKISSMAQGADGQTLFDKYLVTDIERNLRNYIRQVGADIEIKRTFGDVDAKGFFAAANEEYYAVARKMKAEGKSEKEIDAMTKRYRRHVRNLTASISRLRHTWGVPENPEGFAARAAKVMLDLNTLRFMGSVAISSIPDLARPVMKYGIKRAFKSGFVPLISDFKNLRLSARELKLAGGALDPIIHSRALAYSDILEEISNESIPERALHTAASKIGKIALFDYWTSGVKQLSGAMQVAEIMDSIEAIANGAGKADLDRATEFLASVGIDSKTAMQMWGEVQSGGGAKVNGIWLPNTEDWKDAALVRNFRAALRQESDATIITPGLELPLFTNSSVGMRLLFQFKSFAFSSTTKTLMAGMQERDGRVLSGALFSIALGMLSYYISSNLIGGDAKARMEEAGFDHWLDEGIARAGLHGAFSEAQRIAERIPLTAPYANFSGQQTTRRPGSNLIEALLGPSFDLATSTANVITGIDDPTQATARNFFDLLPLQNVFYLRQLFKMVEESVADNLPERRTQ